MSIVLNEYEWAERAIKDKALGKKPYETLSRVAKYYTYKNYTRKEVRRLLDEFLLQCEPTASLVMWSDTLDSAAKYASKYPLVMIDRICITKPEMERIDSLPGKQIRRLAFSLLCIAKYLVSISENTNYWVGTPDNEIMKIVRVCKKGIFPALFFIFCNKKEQAETAHSVWFILIWYKHGSLLKERRTEP